AFEWLATRTPTRCSEDSVDTWAGARGSIAVPRWWGGPRPRVRRSELGWCAASFDSCCHLLFPEPSHGLPPDRQTVRPGYATSAFAKIAIARSSFGTSRT